nr:probable glycosyltransferase STELLO2 [Ipomoea batatas]
MLVQDRNSSPPGSPRVSKFSRDKAASLPRTRFVETKNLDFSLWASENLYKILTIVLLVATVAGLFYLRNAAGDTSTLLCIQSAQTQSIKSELPKINWNNIPAIRDKSSPYANFRSEKWIVVSVSDYPSDSLEKLAKLKGWQLLAVGNSKTPKDWSLKGTIYLSLEMQYSHENPNRTVVNPYIHFGQRSVWPRGLPLENVGEIGDEEFYTEVFGGRQFIQQGISNGLPDVDSVFYFTRKSGLEPFDIRFDDHAPKVALPQGTMVPVNSFNTIFHSSAFWGLMLPVSISSMASDVLRGYWAQRILWEIGGYVVVYPPTIYRYDRIAAYPFSEEKDLHVNVGRLIKFLVSWRSNKHQLFEKILELSYAMAEEGFWTERDLELTAAWLQDLHAIGYLQPRLMSLELDRPRASIGHGDRKEFVPQKLPSVHLGVEEIGTVNYEIGNLIKWRKNFGNIVLIMFCSGPVERTALEWRLLYGRIFKTVIILSEQKNSDLAVEKGQLDYIYRFLPKLFDRYTSAEGFLFLQDDTVLNYWNLMQADKSKLWITNEVSKSWTYTSIAGSSDWILKQAGLVKKVVDTMPVHFQVNYKESVKSDESLTLCESEVFYVPRPFVTDFIDLVNLVGELDIHHKAAIPMFFMAMDSLKKFDPVFNSMVYKEKQPDNSTYYSAEAPAVRPWKVSSEQEFIKLIKVMAAGDPLLMELV